MRRDLVAGILLGSMLAALARDAGACSPAGNIVMGVNDDGIGEAPSAVGDVSVTVRRGTGPESSGCGQSSATSCDDIGSFGLHFVPATDPDSSRDQVGYRVDIVKGTAPGASLDEEGSVLLPSTREKDGEVTLYFNWHDGSTDDQEGIDFTITLTPVDSHGNEGPASRPIRIRDDGDGGCAVGARRFGSPNPALLALLVVSGAALGRRRTRPEESLGGGRFRAHRANEYRRLDANGNEGPPSEPIHIYHPGIGSAAEGGDGDGDGDDGGSCAVQWPSPGSKMATIPLLFGLAGALAARRRTSRGARSGR